jgi:hypothetical protein
MDMKMKYFRIAHETEYNEIGVYEQINELTIPTTKSIREKYHDLDKNRKEFLPQLPSLAYFKITENAKITDVLSNIFFSMNVGFLASERCMNIIKKFNMTNHQFHFSKISGIPDDHKYYFFYLIEESQQINYNKSECCNTDFIGTKLSDPINISSYKEFTSTNIEIQKTRPGILSFTDVCLKNKLDILRLPGDSEIHISERLKNNLEDNNITGVFYKKAKVSFRIE